jgi:hypothetical protein
MVITVTLGCFHTYVAAMVKSEDCDVNKETVISMQITVGTVKGWNRNHFDFECIECLKCNLSGNPR